MACSLVGLRHHSCDLVCKIVGARVILNEALVGLGDQRGMVLDVPLDRVDTVVKRVESI
jgi:hypothetical protein